MVNELKQKVALVNPPLPVDIGHHPLFPPLGINLYGGGLESEGV